MIVPVKICELAERKQIPAAFLQSIGLSESPAGVVFAYRHPDGTPAKSRLRSALKGADGSSWIDDGRTLTVYTAPPAVNIHDRSWAVIVEGESDCWTSWMHGIRAIGIPGSDSVSALASAHLEGVNRVYIQRERNAGRSKTYPQGVGQFVQDVARRLWSIGFAGEILVFEPSVGGDDISEIYTSDPAGFETNLKSSLAQTSTPFDYVLVTGASRGIGASAAKSLAKSGYNLVLWARDEVGLEEVAASCRDQGVGVITATVDVSNFESIDLQGRRSLKSLPGLRGCVLNAGIGVWGKLRDFDVQDWRNTLSTNLDGAFFTLKLAIPLLERHSTPQLVLIGSDSSHFGFPDRGAYCASKWGVKGLIESLRREVRSSGVRITDLVLSRVDTYFRNKTPGNRADCMKMEEVGSLVSTLFAHDPSIEIRELYASAMTTSFGAFPETFSKEANVG